MNLRLSPAVSIYVGRQFLMSFLLMLALFVFVIFLIDLIELMRRAGGKKAVDFGLVLSMAVYKLPQTAQKTLPFAVLFGGMLAFWQLNRHSELVALRAAGVSVWQFLSPILICAAAIGIAKMTLVNPVSTVMISRFEQMENRLLRGRTSLMAVTKTGVWLRQSDASGQSVIHARGSSVSKDGLSLMPVMVLFYKGRDKFVGRLDAKKATLHKGYWELEDVVATAPEKPARSEARYRLKTDLTLSKIQESFSSPSTISFWELPGFINSLEATGFSALSHRLHFYSLLAEPLLYCAMILVAAIFSLRHNRRAGVLIAVAGGIAVGFLLFFLSDLVLALGQSAAIPPIPAAWIPAIAAALLGLTVLLHLEDG